MQKYCSSNVSNIDNIFKDCLKYDEDDVVLVLILRHKILYQKLAINVNKSNLTSCGARVAANNINIAEKPMPTFNPV